MLSLIRCRCASPASAAREGGRSNAIASHVVVAGRVVAEVRGPAAGVGVVPAAAEQQALHQVVADPAGGRGHHPLAAEDDAADGGGVLGHQQRHVLAEEVLRRVDGDQVGRHLVADQDGRDDDGGHAADVRQPQRALAQPGGAQHLAEPGVDHVLAHVGGGLLRRHAGRGRGLHVHQLGDDGDGRGASGRRSAAPPRPGRRPAWRGRTGAGTR